MKYRLKKDLPFAKAGDEVEVKGGEVIVHDRNQFGNHAISIGQYWTLLGDWVEDVEEVKPREFKLQLDSSGFVVGILDDHDIFANGNSFNNIKEVIKVERLLMSEIKIQMLGDRILVRPNALTVTKEGIIIPESAQEPPTTGTVIAVGNALLDSYKDLKIGDFVKLYVSSVDTKSPNWIKLNNEYLLVLRCGDIMGILNELPDLKEVVQPSKLVTIPSLIN